MPSLTKFIFETKGYWATLTYLLNNEVDLTTAIKTVDNLRKEKILQTDKNTNVCMQILPYHQEETPKYGSLLY
jgi:hypothetical protein